MKQHIKVDREADKVVIDAVIAWAHAVEPQSKRTIAVCPSLNITLELDPGEDVVDSINKSMNLFFESAMNHGDLEPFLKTRGWLPPGAKVPARAHVQPRALKIEAIELHDLAFAAC